MLLDDDDFHIFQIADEGLKEGSLVTVWGPGLNGDEITSIEHLQDGDMLIIMLKAPRPTTHYLRRESLLAVRVADRAEPTATVA